MATVLEIIDTSLREIGVLATSETATAADAADALAALNRLLDQWAAERLQIFTITRTTWTITSGTYSVAGTATQPRPTIIDHVAYVDTSISPTVETQLAPLTNDEYAALRMKGLTNVYPGAWYYNPTFPNGTLLLFPIPTSATLTGVLYVPQAVAAFAALTDVISLPPGYRRMLVKNLALELAPGYERQTDPLLFKQAADAVAVVKRANLTLKDMGFTADSLIGSGGGAWSIYSGP